MTLPPHGGGPGFLADCLFDRVHHDFFHDPGANRLPLRAVTGGWAPVERIRVFADVPDGHSAAANTASENTQPGEEPVGASFAAPADPGALNLGPEFPVNYRLVGVEVLEVPEVQFTEVHAAGEEGAGAVVGPVDAVFSQELTDGGDGGTVPAHLKSTLNNRGQLVRNENTVRAFPISGQTNIPGGDTPFDGPSLGLGGPDFHLSAVQVSGHAHHAALEKLARFVRVSQQPNVGRGDTTPSVEYPVKNLKLDGHAAEQPVEERHNDGVGLPRFDAVKRGRKARAILERCAPGHVEFFNDLEELDAVVSAPCGDPVGLFDRANEGFSFSALHSGHADESDRCHCFNCLWCSRRAIKTVEGFSPLVLTYPVGGAR